MIEETWLRLYTYAQIQTRRASSRFFTGITFVFSGASSFRAVEAMKVLAPHREKQSRTIAIFVTRFTG
jgi:hypothetical protein